MTSMFVSLPVSDLERAKAFYTALGFSINPLSTDANAARVVVEDDHSFLMLMARDFFQSQSDRPIGDPAATVTSATLFFLDSREAVDVALAAGLAAGGTEARPAADYGFLYQRQLTDPDGHVLEFGHMEQAAE